MSAWFTIASLVKLRDEFNQLSPNRDKGADGTIGDSSHTSTSDHTPDEDSTALQGKDADDRNEVHALDIDSTGPWPGTTFAAMVLFIVGRCRAGAENRLRYVIFNRKIYHIDDAFRAADYTGADPHTNHAHFSASYVTAREADTRPWGLIEEFDMAVTSAEMDSIAARVWGYMLTNAYSNTDMPAGTILSFVPSKQPHLDTQALVAKLTASLNAFIATETADDTVKAQSLAAIRSAVDAVAPTVTAQILANLPEGSDQITQDEVNAAVKAAFRDAFTA